MKIKIIICLSFIILLSGCSNKECVSSHIEKKTCSYTTYTYYGSNDYMPIIYYYPCEISVCDEWGDK